MKKRWMPFLLLSLFSSMIIVACSPEQKVVQTTAEEAVTPGVSPMSTPDAAHKEAPQLAELVASGKLPPVNQRLPQNPMLVQPVDRVGSYGGVWHMGMNGYRDHALLIRTLGYENLMRWDPQWNRPIPNVAQSLEVSDDATTYTFRLRQGMCWSDGTAFTADDIMFWYEDVFLSKELTPFSPVWLTCGNEPVQVEKVDDYTLVFRFAAPNGLFLQNLATPWGAEPTSYPRHYLKQFHARYNPDNISELIQEAGVANWVALFQLKFGLVGSADHPSRWQNPELPTFNAWVLTGRYIEGATQLVAERNPYYWKIDPNGSQLPYIDRLFFHVAKSREDLVALALKGELDMQNRNISQAQNRARYQANMDLNGYHFYATISSFSNVMGISLNMTHPDPTLRNIFQNKDFRVGLSYAINRSEIIDQVYNGAGEPHQVAPLFESPLYHEQLARQYLEFDKTRANNHLDQAGLDKRNDQGLRLGPTGKPIVFTVEVTPDIYIESVEALKLIQGHWRAVGILMQIKEEDRNTLIERRDTNQHDAVVWASAGGIDVILDPREYFPFSNESNYAVGWGYWYINPKDPRAEQPPAIIMQQMLLYDQLVATGDPSTQNELMGQILEIAANQFYVIGIARPGKGYGIVKNNFQNVPGLMPAAWTYPDPAPTNPAQYFIEQD
jgi:peptide/nickel transport system substrate-binding protein